MARKRLWLVPAATTLDSRVDRGQLSRSADLDLARRAVLSVSFSILTFPIVVFGPSYFTDHPRVVIAAGVCLLGIVSQGLYLSRRIESPPKLTLSTIVLSGSYWGLFYGATVWLYGVDHWITLKFTICAVAICSAATTSFAANLSIMRVFLILLLAPSEVIYLAIGGVRAWSMALGSVSYLGFCLVQGGSRNREYRNALADNALLKIGEQERTLGQHALQQLTCANDALRAREEQFRSLIEQAADCILIASHEACLVEVNSSGCAMTGYSREELLGKPVFDLLTAEDAILMQPFLEEVRAGKTALRETRIQRKDGTLVDVAFSAQMLAGRRLLAFVRDIAQRKAAEERIRTSERQLAGAQRVAHIGSWEWEMRTNQVTWTDELYRIFGLARHTPITYETYLSLVRADDREFVRRIVEASSISLAPFEYDARIVRRDGTSRIVRAQGEVVCDASGRASRMLGTCQDVTDRKQLEEQLAQARKMEAVGQLASGVAHDFNNLLTLITGYTHTILDDLYPDSPLREDAVEILLAADRGSALTNQLLTFSRRQMIQPQILNLNNVVDNLEKMLRRVITGRIEFRTQTVSDLGPVRADLCQIEQVIVNLVLNSRDAMPDGGRLTIETANAGWQGFSGQHRLSFPPGAYVMLAVTDTGHGMDEQTKSRMFEPFFTTKEMGRGTGLGLATVYGIVTQSGGHISVDSEPGKGTIFRIYFPSVEGMPLPLNQAVAEDVQL